MKNIIIIIYIYIKKYYKFRILISKYIIKKENLKEKLEFYIKKDRK